LSDLKLLRHVVGNPLREMGTHNSICAGTSVAQSSIYFRSRM
jgi:hypothetical protein